MFPLRRSTQLPIPDITVGSVVRVYIKGKVWQKSVAAMGTVKGQPMWFEGTVKDCVPGAVVLRGRFMCANFDGAHKQPQDCCRRIAMVDVDHIETVAVAG